MTTEQDNRPPMLLAKKSLGYLLLFGIVLNGVLAVINIDKGGWWWLMVPFQLASSALCGCALYRLRKMPAKD